MHITENSSHKPILCERKDIPINHPFTCLICPPATQKGQNTCTWKNWFLDYVGTRVYINIYVCKYVCVQSAILADCTTVWRKCCKITAFCAICSGCCKSEASSADCRKHCKFTALAGFAPSCCALPDMLVHAYMHTYIHTYMWDACVSTYV